MKLTILLIALSLQVSATAFSQQVSLDYKNAPLQQVMQSILKQTGYGFIIDAINLKLAKPVTVTLKGATIEETLQAIFSSQPFSYRIEGKSIVIQVKGEEKKTSLIAQSTTQLININGKVTDENGMPLPGASVKAGDKVTVTNNKGEFSLSGVDGNTTVDISYVGYATKTIRVGNSEFLIIQLDRKAGELEEVIVNKGYYSTKQELNTGSVEILKAADIAKQPVSDPLMALEGRIPGLYVSQTSGVPGARINIVLRGRNSIGNGNDPLYVVDGIPFNSKTLSQMKNASGGLSPFTSLRPGDIESINILKDADATALYGSRGANGVILITTKQGHAYKTLVNLDVYRGAGVISRNLKLLNTQQYLEMRREGLSNDNATPDPYEYDINGTWDQNRYTDWQKVLIGQTANTTDAKASVSGGNGQTNFLIGLGYRKEDNVFPGDFSNTIASGNANINHRSENDRFQLNLSLNYSNNKNLLPINDFTQYIFLAPNAPSLYDAKGQLNWENNTFNNPLAYALQTANTETENLVNNLTLQYTIIKGLQLKSSFGYTTTRFKEQNITPYASFMQVPGDNAASFRQNNTGYNMIKAYIIEPQINYSFSFKDHHFDALLGTTFNQSNQEGVAENTSGYSSDAQIVNSASATNTRNINFFNQYRYNAAYFRLGYNYKEKYVLNFTGRRDGSSRFGPGKQFGNFGAIGAAWLFIKEDWFNDDGFLSLGKLRASIGRTGNDQFPDYEYLSTYSPNFAYFGISTLNPTRLTNQNYRWETIDKKEGALELGFLNNRILLNMNYYRNRTKNQLVGYPLPYTTGFPKITGNLPAIIENKGLEIEFSIVNIEKINFRWKTAFNLTIPKNKLVSYPGIEKSSYNYSYAVGQPLTVAFLYHYTGLDSKTGLFTFEDYNKDGSISYGDDLKPVFTGQKFYGGLNNTIVYKGFSLDVFIQFVKQTSYRFFSNSAPGLLYYGGLANQPISVLDRWRKVGDQTMYQRFVSRDFEVYDKHDLFINSDGMITDASFIRLKNVMLSYEFPQKWLNTIKVKSFRIYMQGQNLLTFTGYKGMDPENAGSVGYGATPALAPLRVITGGIQLSL